MSLMPLKRALKALPSQLGPGIAVAATGVGAGDLIASTVAGSRFGVTLLWVAVYSALLKYVLNEGLARWQLATGTTLLEGWISRYGRPFQIYFLLYLVGWSFFVGGGLMSACGMAGHALIPALSVKGWAIVHALVGASLVLWGRYRLFEQLMKVFTAVMFVSFLLAASLLHPDLHVITQGLLIPAVPEGGLKAVLSIVGGVGGSLTLLCYGYWIREAGREGPDHMRVTRLDLGVAYGLTGLFGVAVMVLASAVHPESAQGSSLVLSMGERLEAALGPMGRWALYLGFWGAVASSLLGVWQGVPYLFADFVSLSRRLEPSARATLMSPTSPVYRGFLAFLTFPPMLLLLFDKPVAVVQMYTLVGGLFMPFLAVSLLHLNWKREGVLKNSWATVFLLVLALAVFAYLGIRGVVEGVG